MCTRHFGDEMIDGNALLDWQQMDWWGEENVTRRGGGRGGDKKRTRMEKADDGGSSVLGKKIGMKRTEDRGDLIPHTAASRVTHQSSTTLCTANMADFTWWYSLLSTVLLCSANMKGIGRACSLLLFMCMCMYVYVCVCRISKNERIVHVQYVMWHWLVYGV